MPTTSVCGGHAASMDNQPGSRETQRRQEIGQRLDALRTRINELKADRRGDADRATSSERLASAERHLVDSQAAAQQAIAASVRTLRRAAEAHERAALQHERAAMAGVGDTDEHRREKASHRAAAVADTRQAERAQSQLRDEESTGGREQA